MRILITRLSNERHRLAVERDDGTGESCELESRSVLLHDLVHYAVEAEASFERGFWGLVASGRSFASLVPESGTFAEGEPELALAERLVGPMQAVWHERLPKERYVVLAQLGLVDEAFVARVLERVRRLWGQLKGTPFHETMELRWPPIDGH